MSPDSVKSHQDFIAEHRLKTTLLSDPERRAIEDFGVWQLKVFFGEERWGVARSTFIINPEGVIAEAWRDVKVSGHVDEVKRRLSELQQGA